MSRPFTSSAIFAVRMRSRPAKLTCVAALPLLTPPHSTWIIIVLIVVACFVACGEISARMVLHARDVSRRAPSVLLENVPLSLPRIGAVSQAQAHFG